jgi:hypothetical protein
MLATTTTTVIIDRSILLIYLLAKLCLETTTWSSGTQHVHQFCCCCCCCSCVCQCEHIDHIPRPTSVCLAPGTGSRGWGVCAQWGGQVWRFPGVDVSAATSAATASAATRSTLSSSSSRVIDCSGTAATHMQPLHARMMVGQYGVSIRRQLRPPTFAYLAAASAAADGDCGGDGDGSAAAGDCEWMFVSSVTSNDSLTAVHVPSGCLFDLTPALASPSLSPPPLLSSAAAVAPPASSALSGFKSSRVEFSSIPAAETASSSSSSSNSSSSSRDSEIIGVSGIGNLVACVRNSSITLLRYKRF